MGRSTFITRQTTNMIGFLRMLFTRRARPVLVIELPCSENATEVAKDFEKVSREYFVIVFNSDTKFIKVTCLNSNSDEKVFNI